MAKKLAARIGRVLFGVALALFVCWWFFVALPSVFNALVSSTNLGSVVGYGILFLVCLIATPLVVIGIILGIIFII